MPWVRDDADGLQVPGLYQALLERECERQERADRRVTYATAGFPLMRRDRRLLDTLEAGKPAVVPTGQLGGWGVPKVPRTNEQKQWGHWFKVFPDDSVKPAEDDDGTAAMSTEHRKHARQQR